MFPRLRQRLGKAVLDRIDTLVELSTLGEYGLAEDGLPVPIAGPDDLRVASAGPKGLRVASAGPEGGPTLIAALDRPRPRRLGVPRSRDRCPSGGRVSAACCERPARP